MQPSSFKLKIYLHIEIITKTYCAKFKTLKKYVETSLFYLKFITFCKFS